MGSRPGKTKFFPPRALRFGGWPPFGPGMALAAQMFTNRAMFFRSPILDPWCSGFRIFPGGHRRCGLLAGGVACFNLSTFVLPDSKLSGCGYFLSLGRAAFCCLQALPAALFTRSRHAAHFLALFSIGWCLLLYAGQENKTVLLLMIVIGIGLILADGLRHEQLQKLTRFAHPLAAYGALPVLVSFAILQLDSVITYVGVSAGIDRDILYSMLILALSIGAIAICGRDNGGLRSHSLCGILH